MRVIECKVGMRVVYRPIINKEPAFVGTVREAPWELGDGTFVTHLEMGADYAAWRNDPTKLTVHGAAVRHLEAA